jgi:hypothetical protein
MSTNSPVEPPSGPTELQFDRVIAAPTGSVVSTPTAASCTACQNTLDTEYYSVNDHAVCGSCRNGIEQAAQTPRGAWPFIRAGLFGLGAGIVGAAIYYAVIALANLEIGIVAILIGYMVGYAVRRGAGGRGGRRFQVLAIALTYGAVALAYTPVLIKATLDREKTDTASAITKNAGATPAPTPLSDRANDEPSAGSALIGLIFALGIIAALPVITVFGTLPSGLISAAIIFFGMRQAWVMTGVSSLRISGPYRVGSDPAPTAA